jgi:hypothetical protein
MASCATQTFSGITQARFNALIQKASSFGITVSGDSGQASKDGVTIRWAFDPTAQTLELQCLSAPFFIGCGTVNSQIHNLVDATEGVVAAAAGTGTK